MPRIVEQSATILTPLEQIPLMRQDPAIAYLNTHRDDGERTMRQCLTVLAGRLTGGYGTIHTCPWGRVRYAETAELREYLAQRYAPATANKMLTALRGVMKAAWRLGLLSAEDLAQTIDLPAIRGKSLPAGRDVSQDELALLLGACTSDDRPAGQRDAALIALIYSTGIRREEAVTIQLSHYNTVSGRLVIFGKGGKERGVWVPPDASLLLGYWLLQRCLSAGPLFCRISPQGRVQLARGRLSAQTVYNIMLARAAQAGIERLSPHDLRRTFVGDLLDAGVDLSLVARMVGHSNVDTTAAYDRRPDSAQRGAAALIRLPEVNTLSRTQQAVMEEETP